MRTTTQRNTYIKLALQLLVLVLLFCPLFNRVETDPTMTVFSALLSIVSTPPFKATYSYVGAIGLSLVFNPIIFISLFASVASLCILVFQTIKKRNFANNVNSILIHIQTAAFAILGLLTTSTITTTLTKGNTKFYLKALLGIDNIKALQSMGAVSGNVLDKMYGTSYYDYWGFLKLRPLWFVAMAVLIALSIIATASDN